MALELRNGRDVLHEVYLYHPTKEFFPVTKTDDYTVLKTDAGKLLIMNAGTDKTFSLPSVSAADIGLVYAFAGIGAARITIDAADSDIIDDSNAGATIYSDDDGSSIASIVLELVAATKWAIRAANGTWVTT